MDLDLTATEQHPLLLGRHLAFRLSAPTLKPVARKGDILIVCEIGEPSPKSLVVARCEGRVVARRFEIADNHSDIAVLTTHSINPAQLRRQSLLRKQLYS